MAKALCISCVTRQGAKRNIIGTQWRILKPLDLESARLRRALELEYRLRQLVKDLYYAAPFPFLGLFTTSPTTRPSHPQGAVVDGVVAQDIGQVQSMWSLREHAPVAVSLAGYTYKYDVSVPVQDFPALADETRRRLQGLCCPEATVVAYGHLGDGNLHLNVSVPEVEDSGGKHGGAQHEGGNEKVLAALEPFVFEWVVSRGGSISAEHGIGQHKRDYLALQRPGPVLGLMKGVKDMLDPRGIMNPYKVLPDA